MFCVKIKEIECSFEKETERTTISIELNQLYKVLSNAKKIAKQRKGPQMLVYDPNIFEEALHNSGIKHTRLPDRADTEDLLYYALCFPSGCRMVVAVPMNGSTKEKEKKPDNK